MNAPEQESAPMRNLVLLIAAIIFFAGWYFSPTGFYYFGNYRFNQWRYEDAIATYSRAIDSNRLRDALVGKAYFGRGQAKYYLAYATLAGDAMLVSALVDLSKAIEENPAELYYLRERGGVYANLGAYEEAFADFERMYRLEIAQPFWSLVRRAGLLKRLGQYEEALDVLDELLVARGYQPAMPIFYHMGLIYVKMQDYEQAVAAFDKGIPAQPDYGWAFIKRSCAKAKLGKYDEALEDYLKGRQLVDEAIDDDKPVYPSDKHNERVQAEEIEILQKIQSGVIDDPASAVSDLCENYWWNLHIDVKRERSELL